MKGKKKVTYFYDPEIGNFYYGAGHPMKPHRIRMAHNLMVNYGLHKKMEMFRPKPATDKEMTQFHSDEYISFLKSINLENMYKSAKQMNQCSFLSFSFSFSFSFLFFSFLFFSFLFFSFLFFSFLFFSFLFCSFLFSFVLFYSFLLLLYISPQLTLETIALFLMGCTNFANSRREGLLGGPSS